MALPFYNWLRTAAGNATADSTINWQEGQAPSSINDSARAMMASTAAFRDDIAGAIVTGGTSTAYTVSSYQVFDTLAHLNGQMIAFTPHITNGATVTLNVDGIGAKPLRTAPNAELLAGVIIQGTPYVATYNNSDGAFYLQGFFGNPYNMPLAGGLDYWGTTVPNSAFAFPYGQAINRTTYASLFAIMGTTYGVGDGSTTFNIPDVRGRVIACPDNMGGASAGRISGATVNTMAPGGIAGQELHTLTLSELPTGISSSTGGAVTVNVPSSGYAPVLVGQPWSLNSTSGSGNPFAQAGTGGGSLVNATSFSTSGAVTSTSTNTSGSTHPIMQPTILANRIIRIL